MLLSCELQDVCPEVSNPEQNPSDCQPDVSTEEPEFDGCPYGPDSVWNITWANTERGENDTQRCPGGVDTLGMAFHEDILIEITSIKLKHQRLYYVMMCMAIMKIVSGSEA